MDFRTEIRIVQNQLQVESLNPTGYNANNPLNVKIVVGVLSEQEGVVLWFVVVVF